MKTLILLTTALLITTGCNEEKKKETPVYTVEYYTKHDDLRKQRIKECKALVTITTNQERDCDNASRAAMIKRMEKMPDLSF